MFRRLDLEERISKLESGVLEKCKIFDSEGKASAAAKNVALDQKDFQELMLILKDIARELKAIRYFG